MLTGEGDESYRNNGDDDDDETVAGVCIVYTTMANRYSYITICIYKYIMRKS